MTKMDTMLRGASMVALGVALLAAVGAVVGGGPAGRAGDGWKLMEAPFALENLMTERGAGLRLALGEGDAGEGSALHLAAGEGDAGEGGVRNYALADGDGGEGESLRLADSARAGAPLA